MLIYTKTPAREIEKGPMTNRIEVVARGIRSTPGHFTGGIEPKIPSKTIEKQRPISRLLRGKTAQATIRQGPLPVRSLAGGFAEEPIMGERMGGKLEPGSLRQKS